MRKSIKQEVKKNTEKSTQKVKKDVKQVREKASKATKKTKGVVQQANKNVRKAAQEVKKEYNSPRGKKVRGWIKKTSEVIGSHLAMIKAGVTLSNEEAKLLENLKENLNKKGIYPSKSEILRAGLWNLKKMNSQQLEETLKELIKVKQVRIL